MNFSWDEPWVSNVRKLARNAGNILLELSPSRGGTVRYKGDESPVTLADTRSDGLIQNGLRSLTPGIPVISEETSIPDYTVRCTYETYWLIDPLDGTKEFVAGLDESCVCIALIQRGHVVFSVIDAPFWKTSFLAVRGAGAREYSYDSDTFQELPLVKNDPVHEVKILQSRSKPVLEGRTLQSRPIHWIPMGSALKFCSLARGEAHLYYRWTPFYEWDAAAGHLIAEEAGAKVFGLRGEEVLYNRKNLLLDGLILSTLDVSLAEILEIQR
jgi:3'(2'), 5'-bisphosphate nucleotidase